MNDKPRIIVRQCPHCDFGSGYRGMDGCGRCGGTGSVFSVGVDGEIRNFPNTEAGFNKALKIGRWEEPNADHKRD